jgi:hypothetical protein
VFVSPAFLDKPDAPIPLWQIAVFAVTLVAVVESIGYAAKRFYLVMNS